MCWIGINSPSVLGNLNLFGKKSSEWTSVQEAAKEEEFNYCSKNPFFLVRGVFWTLLSWNCISCMMGRLSLNLVFWKSLCRSSCIPSKSTCSCLLYTINWEGAACLTRAFGNWFLGKGGSLRYSLCPMKEKRSVYNRRSQTGIFCPSLSTLWLQY